MKKRIILPLILSALAITACGPSANKSADPLTSGDAPISGEISGDTSNSSNNSSSEYVEDYPITVTQTQGVTVTLPKKRAVKGEKITFSVVASAGYRITDVKTNSATVTKESGDNYSFVMPERSVRITVSVAIDGDFVLTGDFSAKLEKEGDLYVARNVKVPYTTGGSDYAEFTYVVQNNGQSTRLKSLALDETRCFANVSFTTSKDNELRVATGCTYDFFYDVNSGERPCYVIRKSVDAIPSTGEALFTRVFDGRMRSEPTLHAPDLVGIAYTYNASDLKYSYNYTKYKDNKSLATIFDTTDPDNTETYNVYKHADLDNGVYTVVNTWPKDKGNNENEYALWELDPYGDSYGDGKTHKAFSARLDITEEETDMRMEISKRDAIRNVGMGAHYGTELEYEFYDAYRSVFSGNVIINAPSYTDPGYSVQPNADGTFKVTVNSLVEYDRDESGSTADVTDHSGHTNELVIDFLKNGAVKTMSWTRRDYAQNQWNFAQHKPINVNNCVSKTITCTNTYGNVNSGTPSFDTSKYFISGISKVSWYNKENTDGKSATVSNVCFGDTLELYPYGEAGNKSSIVDQFAYTPSTALDMWQYGVTESANKNIVDINGQNKYEVVNVGETSVTVGNRAKNVTAPSVTVNLKSQATRCALQFYVDFRVQGYDSYGCDDSTTLIAKAGKTSTYYVDVSAPSGKKAPCSYSFLFVTGKDPLGNLIYNTQIEYLTYTVEGHKLTLNCNTEASLALDKTAEITAYVISDYYQEGRTPTQFTIKVLPAVGGDIVGSNWVYNTYVDDQGNRLDSQTDIHFYNKHATGYGDNIYEGKIVDNYSKGTVEYTDEYKFVYQVNSLGIIVAAQITEVTMEDPLYKNASANSFFLCFNPITDDGLLPTVLWYETSENLGYILGEAQWDEEYQVVDIHLWQCFTRI